MKKLLITITLILISIYYTNICINILKNKDPLMQELKQISPTYYKEPQDSKIINNSIIPGLKGTKVNINKTYTNIKKYSSFNKNLIVLDKVNPKVSIDTIYNKYIERGNPTNKNISIVYILDNNIDKVLSIFNKKKVPINIFINYKDVDKYKSIIKNNNIELIDYNNKYLFIEHKNYLENITNRKVKFCYIESYNKEVIDICSKYKLHTIKPYIILEDNILEDIKKNISNSIIIEIKLNNKNIDKLPILIDYIKSKGYAIVTLSNLIKQ